jgi:phosphoribosylformylglycinamidine cyclo-ligase
MSKHTDENKKPMTYAEAGVSVARGNEAVEQIKCLAESTRRAEVVGGIGSFAGSFRLGGEELLAGADGVGSKLLLAKALKRYDTIGIDLVAMNVNDVLASGGEPLFFLDYVALGRLEPGRVRDLVKGVADGCRQAGAALLGGETAEMPDLYPEDDFDLSGFAVGRRVFSPRRSPEPGDTIIGLASSGFHSNGYQLIRRVVAERWGGRLDEVLPALAPRTLGEALLTPTRIYVKAVMALWPKVQVGAMAHITGGGLIENIPRTLAGLGAALRVDSWPMLPEMALIQEWGSITADEMARTFNCGLGFTLTIPAGDWDAAQDVLNEHAIPAYRVGEVTRRPGVVMV